jgi:hypothetical protein
LGVDGAVGVSFGRALSVGADGVGVGSPAVGRAWVAFGRSLGLGAMVTQPLETMPIASNIAASREVVGFMSLFTAALCQPFD